MKYNSEIYTNKEGQFIIFPQDAIGIHLKAGKLWEPHFKTVIDTFLKPGDIAIDCGANFGYNSVLMGKKLSNKGLLIAFEPQKIIYQQMNGNLILNNIYNTLTYQMAVGDKISEVHMAPINYDFYGVNIGNLSIGNNGEKVKMVKLDDLDLEKVNFIKLDIQGYELFALQGAQNLLSTFKPDLFIEIEDHQLAKFDVKRSQLVEYIKSFGYRMFKINNKYPCDHICTINNFSLIEKLYDKLPLVEV